MVSISASESLSGSFPSAKNYPRDLPNPPETARKANRVADKPKFPEVRLKVMPGMQGGRKVTKFNVARVVRGSAPVAAVV